MKKVNIEKIVELLNEEDAPRSIFVNYMEDNHDPYLVLISCILSLRTKDETTYPATLRLFELGKTPQDIIKHSVDEIENAIYPVGFFRNKAKQIYDLSVELIEKYNGIVPDDVEELTKFKGVGRKTANLVVAKGHQKPAICVDIHVHRICNRWGYVKTKNPDDTEMLLRKKLPKKFWVYINTLLVTHGQNTCKPIKPKCNKCVIKEYCNQIL